MRKKPKDLTTLVVGSRLRPPYLRTILWLGPLMLALACGSDDLLSPAPGNLAIRTSTTGPEPDPDGYVISVNDGADVAIGVNGTHQFTELVAGSHTVRLGGMAANCVLEGENPRMVSVEAGTTTTVQLNVTCGPTTGSLRVTVSTTGVESDPDGYTITLDGADRGTLAASTEVTIEALARGNHVLGLSGVAANCQVAGENPRAVTITTGISVTAVFTVACAAPPPVTGSVRVTTITTGGSPDTDGYAFAIDGGTSQPIGTSASATVSGVAAGERTVTLSGLAGNCVVQGANPRPVTLAAGATAEMIFSVSCSPAGTTGSLEITTATTGGSLDDGYTFTVDNGTAQPIGINETVTVPEIPAGPHQIALAGIVANCTVTGENPRSAPVTAGLTSPVRFDVTCQSPQPSSGKIAFLSERDNLPENESQDLYVMNPDGTGVQRLTVGSDVLSFDWAPSGSRLVFESFRDQEIYAINVDGSGLVRLTNTPNIREQGPDWSPDGSRIAFLQGNGIYVMNADGAEVRKVVNGAYVWDWSPDGRQIAFLGHEFLGRQNDYYVINVDGSGEINLTNNRDHKQAAPHWSPDGRWIAYVAGPFGETWPELYSIRADGSEQRRLTNDPGGESDPIWSPDSRRIAYSTDRDRVDTRDSREIYIMDADGSGQTNLTNTPRQDSDPSENSELVLDWAPDGSKLLYSRMGRIWVMNSDGSAQTDLDQAGTDSDWSPR